MVGRMTLDSLTQALAVVIHEVEKVQENVPPSMFREALVRALDERELTDVRDDLLQRVILLDLQG